MLKNVVEHGILSEAKDLFFIALMTSRFFASLRMTFASLWVVKWDFPSSRKGDSYVAAYRARVPDYGGDDDRPGFRLPMCHYRLVPCPVS
ncbi:MAG: hypothetical protein ACRD06_08105, partial [Terriglobia bacterium]